MGYELGVDLGTTYTAAATHRNGSAQIVELGNRSATIPSVIYLTEDDKILTGEAANRRAASNPGRVAREFKRRIGDPTPVILGGSPYSAESLSARLLEWVIARVREREGEAPARVAVTHPANWGPYKLDLLHQAFRLANLEQVHTLSEPEAAAIHYSHLERIDPGNTVAVFDLGGGTFDAAILRKKAQGFDILGEPEGIERLGGIDFDAAVFAFVREAIGEPMEQLDPSDASVVAAVARLRRDCVDAKEALSSDTEVTIPVVLPGVHTDIRLTRMEFEQMIRPSLADTIGAMERAVRSASLQMDEIDLILLVGGSSRIPLVGQMVGGELGRPVAVDAHPKHSVAQGAAWAAADSGGANLAQVTGVIDQEAAAAARAQVAAQAAAAATPAAPADPPPAATPPAAEPAPSPTEVAPAARKAAPAPPTTVDPNIQPGRPGGGANPAAAAAAGGAAAFGSSATPSMPAPSMPDGAPGANAEPSAPAPSSPSPASMPPPTAKAEPSSATADLPAPSMPDPATPPAPPTPSTASESGSAGFADMRSTMPPPSMPAPASTNPGTNPTTAAPSSAGPATNPTMAAPHAAAPATPSMNAPASGSAPDLDQTIASPAAAAAAGAAAAGAASMGARAKPFDPSDRASGTGSGSGTEQLEGAAAFQAASKSSSKTGLLVGIGAVVLLAIVGLVLLTQTGGDDPDDDVVADGGTTTVADDATEDETDDSGPEDESDDGTETTEAPDEESTTTEQPTTTTTAPTTTTTEPCAGLCTRFIDPVVQDDGELLITWEAINFDPDVGNFHAHFFFDIYEPEQVGSNWRQNGAASQGNWQLTDEVPFNTAGTNVDITNAPAGATQLCVVAADSGHGVVNPDNVDCIDLP